jgi:hypothetical protein
MAKTLQEIQIFYKKNKLPKIPAKTSLRNNDDNCNLIVPKRTYIWLVLKSLAPCEQLVKVRNKCIDSLALFVSLSCFEISFIAYNFIFKVTIDGKSKLVYL